MTSTIRFALINPHATPPTRKHPADAGMDIHALAGLEIPSFSCAIVHTGVTFEIPEGYMLQVWPKSRNDHLVGAGILDSGYQGEVLIKVVNYSSKTQVITPGMAVAQLVMVPVATPVLEAVSPEEIHRQKSTRGATGGIVNQ